MNTLGKTDATTAHAPVSGSRPAEPVHRRQGIRYPGRDYRQPAFYMITMSTLDRRPRFGTCADNRVTLSDEGCLVLECWQRMTAADLDALKRDMRLC